jgi:error-prone DNA polymerase
MTNNQPTATSPPYAELHCHSYFSLLDGASSPEELATRAGELGLTALALTDHDSLAGAVRFWNAVHPYLRRRAGREPVTYDHPCLEPVLAETLGVLLFQEQAIRVAVVAAGFSPGEADLLRRALSRKNPDHELAALAQRFTEGAAQRGIDAAAAQQIFEQLAGFAGYGFCKSHAASFALLAYQTLYLKRYHPAAFYCALLNAQPMGFYPPEVLIGDARRHGVTFLPPHIHHSGWTYTLARAPQPRLAVRTGLCAITGLGDAAWQRLQTARDDAPFTGLADLVRRSGLDRDVIANLIRAGALDDFGARRDLLWQLGATAPPAQGLDLDLPAIAADLPPLHAVEQTLWEYELMGLSPARQLLVHYREALRARGVCSTWQIKQMDAGRKAMVAGLVVIRQRPATARGVTFLSLEDESGLLDLVIQPAIYTRLRDLLHHDALLLVRGLVQRSGRAVSLLVSEASALRHVA